jgi:tRNA(Ile)-lysidine synthase
MPDTLLHHCELDTALAPLGQAGHWYLGYSGGLDSTVLLHLMHRWCRENPRAPAFSAIHINHQLQDEASEWQEHCRWMCRMLQVPFVTCAVDVESGERGPEAAAREARYQVFEEQLGAGDVLFLAHHQDDQVETFFLRLLRGAGVQGLAGMAGSRALGDSHVARPLLGIGRQRLEDYAQHHNLSWIEDPSNQDTDLDRNFLRQEVLPLLATRWPGYRRTVSRASEHLAGSARLLEEEVSVPATIHSAMGDSGIALVDLADVDPETAALNLRSWLRAAGLPAPDRSLLEEFLRQLREGGEDSSPELNTVTYVIRRYQQGVFLLPDGDWSEPQQALSLGQGEVLEVPGVGRLALMHAVGEGLILDADEVPAVVWRQGGERCRPRGRSRSNTLKKLLQEACVPPWWRERVPLLYLDDELLAVGDLWLCESSRLGESAGDGEFLWQLCWQRDI